MYYSKEKLNLIRNFLQDSDKIEKFRIVKNKKSGLTLWVYLTFSSLPLLIQDDESYRQAKLILEIKK